MVVFRNFLTDSSAFAFLGRDLKKFLFKAWIFNAVIDDQDNHVFLRHFVKMCVVYGYHEAGHEGIDRFALLLEGI